MRNKYKLIDAIQLGSYARKDIKPSIIVNPVGDYRPGDLLDANSIVQYVRTHGGSGGGGGLDPEAMWEELGTNDPSNKIDNSHLDLTNILSAYALKDGDILTADQIATIIDNKFTAILNAA